MNRTFITRECLGKALWLCLCLSIAGCAEDDRMTPLSADSGDTADELIPIQISLTGDNDYHSSSFNDASTRNHSPLIAEWVGVKAFSPTRTGEQPDYEVLAHVKDRHCATVVGIRGRHSSQVGSCSGIKGVTNYTYRSRACQQFPLFEYRSARTI